MRRTAAWSLFVTFARGSEHVAKPVGLRMEEAQPAAALAAARAVAEGAGVGEQAAAAAVG